MKFYPILALGFTVVSCLLTSQTTSRGAEENSGVFYHSPGGGYDVDFIEVNGANHPFVVSTKNRAERALLPEAVAEWDVTEVTLRFHASPDEKWILNTESWRHHGVQGQELYQVKSGVAFEPFKEKEWFTKAVRAYAIENGGFKDMDFLAQRGENVYENHLITSLLRLEFRFEPVAHRHLWRLSRGQGRSILRLLQHSYEVVRANALPA